MLDYRKHRLYNEYISLINDDSDFSYNFQDNEKDFTEWVNYYIDNLEGKKWVTLNIMKLD